MTSSPQRERPARDRPESLADLLGGRRGAVDATVPPVAFALGWLVADLWGGVLSRWRPGRYWPAGGCVVGTGRARC
jgi:hypothetical protein